MTLSKRLDRLEGTTVKLETGPNAIFRKIVQPSANGPELVSMMLRPLHGGDAVHTDRAPGETEIEMRTRFEELCKSVLVRRCWAKLRNYNLD